MKEMKFNFRQLLSIISKEVHHTKDKPFTIVLEGNIGSGKTTFLNYFKNNPAIHIDCEPLDLWQDCNGHNLLALQYEDASKWSATLQSYIQLTMLQLHTKQISQPVRLMERSIYSARYCFVENMMRQKIMPAPSATVLDKWHNFITQTIPVNIDLIVYLRTSPEVVYKRMLTRHRSEEATVSFEYIKNLHNLHEEWLAKEHKIPAPVLVIDGNLEKHCFEDEFLQHEDKKREIYGKV